MTLDEYLGSEGAPAASEFAAKVGISEASLSRIRKGAQNVSRNVMRDIIAQSQGKVTADSLVMAA
jgi:DNA-binding transcriptional regulator YdaS (Cro superfamily)